uniref:Protein kinase domain-containing protein n=1 Tax=Amphimedon queenslandica TaxID=400682 RepID=A0A1X7T4T7_AMPQE
MATWCSLQPVEYVEHGSIPVSEVAPDLAFADLPSSILYRKGNISKLEVLGSGGFGSVYKGLIEEGQVTVAIKEFSSIAGKMEEDTLIGHELNAWDIYINGSREARMMHQLQHKNILSLVGLAFQPLRLILELAPLGDLKNSLKPFRQEKIKLNCRTLKQLIYQ